MLNWIWRSFQELNTTELYEILTLRQDVFVIEQKCFYNDLDYRDQQAMHLLGIQDNKLVAYLRAFQKGVTYPEAANFGRVLTAPSVRGQGLGKKLIQEVVDYFDQNHEQPPVIISAQLYLEKFYQHFGFRTSSAPFDEAGIPHIKMLRLPPHEKI